MDSFDQVSGVKRRAADGADDAAQPRGADAARPAERVNAGAAKQEEFNDAYLRFYYRYLFPYNQMFRWLAYGNDPDSTNPKVRRDYFLKREFTFTMAEDVYIRYLCFRDEAGLMKAVNARQPHKIDIGPVYNQTPDKHNQLKGGEKFRAEERELIFDIDLTDYDDIRTCCTGANICRRCWAFMAVAIRVLDSVLRTSFGFQNLMFVYSGRRGVHCWVCDDEARTLTDEARSAVVSHISVLIAASHGGGGGAGDDAAGGAGGGGGGGAATGKGFTVSKVMGGLTVPMQPVFSAALRELELVFESAVIPASGQGLLASPEQWNKLLEQMPDFPTGTEGVTLKQLLAKEWERPSNTPEQRWRQLRDTVRKLVDMAGGSLARGLPRAVGSASSKKLSITLRQRGDLERLIPGIIFTYTFPRLDVEVSKHRNHLLKAPFCIHPKTGRVCVPIDPARADAFDPTAVPTVARLQEEGTRWAKENGKGAFAPALAAAAAAAAAARAGAGASSGAGVGGDNEGGDEGAPPDGGPAAAAASSSSSARARGDMEGMQDATSLQPYVKMFEAFVKQCEAETFRALREASAASAAYTSNW